MTVWVEVVIFLIAIVGTSAIVFNGDKAIEQVHESYNAARQKRDEITLRIMGRVRNDPLFNWHSVWDKLVAVNITDHAKLIRKGRDPKELYDPLVLEFWDEQESPFGEVSFDQSSVATSNVVVLRPRG